jgi:hypothetical protein
LAWTLRAKYGLYVSTASHKRFSRCATHGVNHRRSGHSPLEAHDARAVDGRGLGQALARVFPRTFGVFSSYVASVNNALSRCHSRKMQAVSPSAPWSSSMFSPCPRTVSFFASSWQDPHDRRDRLILSYCYACVSGLYSLTGRVGTPARVRKFIQAYCQTALVKNI